MKYKIIFGLILILIIIIGASIAQTGSVEAEYNPYLQKMRFTNKLPEFNDECMDMIFPYSVEETQAMIESMTLSLEQAQNIAYVILKYCANPVITTTTTTIIPENTWNKIDMENLGAVQ